MLRCRVDAATLAALERVRSSGRKLLLVSGRELEDLGKVFDRFDLFDRLVLENGALVVNPATRDVRALADAPPPELVARLRALGVAPLDVGRVIVATREPHQTAVLEVIRELGLELQVIFNKGAVMVLPSSVNKAFGLRAALADLGLSPHNVVAVGDAENDHAFLSCCECGVAVANALETLKEHADWITPSSHGRGVQELVEQLVENDLLVARPKRRSAFVLGTDDEIELTVDPMAGPVMIAGTSGAGKSTLTTALIEQLAEKEYQFCVIDPEGDYTDLEGVGVLGDAKHAPSTTEALEMLARPSQSVIANLVGAPLADRPGVFMGLWARLLELRERTGRPHWIIIDEAHHLLPQSLETSSLLLPRELAGILLVTVHPETVAPDVLARIEKLVVVGATPADTIRRLARTIGKAPPEVPEGALPPGEGLLWQLGEGVRRFKAAHSKSEHHRHVRKYAAGDLGPERSFYFRGPERRLNLRAQNLEMFVQMADGVDDETWLHHLARGDVARWFRQHIKDEELAQVAEALEGTVDASETRTRIREAIANRYTAPA